MIRKLAVFALLLAPAAGAQTITQQPVDVSVPAGQDAVFTVGVSGGPCRSFWSIGGVGHFGSIGSTVSYTIPKVSTTQSGTKVQAEMYSCAGGPADLRSNIVTLTVTSAVPATSITVSTSISYDDGSVPPASWEIDQIVTNPDGTHTATPVLQLKPDATGKASGTLALDPAMTYRAQLLILGVPFPAQPPLYDAGAILQSMPQISQATISMVLVKANGTLKSISSGAS